MKFFSTVFHSLASFSLRHAILLVSAFLAVIIWISVVYTDKMEKDVTLNINYKNLPADRVITSGRIQTANALINGPEILMSSLHKSYSIDIDVSKVKVGKEIYNTFSILDEMKKNFSASGQRGFSVINIQPAIITLSVEHVERINVNLDVEYKSEGNQYAINAYPHYPQTVTLIGPESEIEKLKHLSSLPVDVFVDLLELGKDVSREIPIIIPAEYDCPLVHVEPSSTKVRYRVIGERVNITYSYGVNLSVKDPNMYAIEPENIVLTLKVPSNRQRDTEYLNSLRVTALPPNLADGESKIVKVNFTTPEGMEVIGGQTTVRITRKNIKKESETVLMNNMLVKHQQNSEDPLKNQKRLNQRTTHRTQQPRKDTAVPRDGQTARSRPASGTGTGQKTKKDAGRPSQKNDTRTQQRSRTAGRETAGSPSRTAQSAAKDRKTAPQSRTRN